MNILPSAALAALFLTSPVLFSQEEVAFWKMDGLNDSSAPGSVFSVQGEVKPASLKGAEKKLSKRHGGDGKVFEFNGGFLDAGQGERGELNLSGNAVSILVRFKASMTEDYSEILSKGGNDQEVACIVALRKLEKGLYVETLMGNDAIAGAHRLRFLLPSGSEKEWHDVILRFDGKKSQLYVDGGLADNDVTVGEIRAGNPKPLTVGGPARFKGRIDHIGLWNRCLSDKEIMKYCGVKSLKDIRPDSYNLTYRPQFHFSPKKDFQNDPNGLFYYKGIYHLFYQCWPSHRPEGFKDWGHATSTDLVHWTQDDNRITPDLKWGGCWSGSAVVDWNNDSGLQEGKEKPVLAFITCGCDMKLGIGPDCTQCVAYSVDGGESFKYYEGNPVVDEIRVYNRDPKVVWDSVSKQWVMVLYLGKGSEYSILVSRNLLDWEQASTYVLEGDSECPGFCPLDVDGDPAQRKWIFFGAQSNYTVGTFDGKKYVPQTEPLRLDYGLYSIASQTWNDLPDGRCVHIAWIPATRFPGMPSEQQMSFPTELTLHSTPSGIRAYRKPVREISSLYEETTVLENVTVAPGSNPLSMLDSDLYDIEFEIPFAGVSSFDLNIRDARLHFDASDRTLSLHAPTLRDSDERLGNVWANFYNGIWKLRLLVDRTSLELFCNDGEFAVTSSFFPSEDCLSYSFIPEKEMKLTVRIHKLRSIWR